MPEKNPHTTYTITAHRCGAGSTSSREVGKSFTTDRDLALAAVGAFAEQLGNSIVEASAAAQAAIEKADQGGEGRLSRNGGFIVVDALCQAISTARPAVAMVYSPVQTDSSIHF